MIRNKNSSKQINLSNIKSILSTTDLKGIIKYTDYYFSEISGYSKAELIGSPQSIVRHPDMPKVIFRLMWNRLENDEDFLAIIKNRTKDGDYYWVTAVFKTKYHPLTKERNGYSALLHAAPKYAVKMIEPLYKKLVEIEAMYGINASQDYLIKFLMRQEMTYDEYVDEINEHKGFSASVFDTVKRMVS